VLTSIAAVYTKKSGELKTKISREIACVFVPFYHIASVIVNANHGIM
jgi:hypothetical protein